MKWLQKYSRTILLSLCALFIVSSLGAIGYYIYHNDTAIVQQQTDPLPETPIQQTPTPEEDTIDLRSTRNIDREFGIAVRSYENATYTIEILVKTPSASQKLIGYVVKDGEEIRLGSLEKDEEDGSYVLAYSSRKDLSGNIQIHIKDTQNIIILTGKN